MKLDISRLKDKNAKKCIIAILVVQGFLIFAAYIKERQTGHAWKDNQKSASFSVTDEVYDEQRRTPYSVINTQRVNRIREYCTNNKEELTNTYPNYERLRIGLTLYVWMASPRHHLFYCATPKCASTTWKTYIMKDLGMEWTADTHMWVCHPCSFDFIHSFRYLLRAHVQ